METENNRFPRHEVDCETNFRVKKNCALSDSGLKSHDRKTRSPALRVEPLDSPRCSIPDIDLTDVEPARHSPPELDASRRDEKARPVRRPLNRLARETLLSLGDAIVEVGRTGHGLALRRRPRADLAPPRSGREIRVSFGVAHRLCVAFHAHLELQRGPVKAERRVLRLEQLAALSALEVRVEDETAFVDGLE